MTGESAFSAVRKLWDKIRPTDGPGHTDYPENDIRTHRSLARTNRLFGWLILGGGTAAFLKTSNVMDGLGYLGFAAIFAALLWWSSIQFRLEALEWEVELARGESDD